MSERTTRLAQWRNTITLTNLQMKELNHDRDEDKIENKSANILTPKGRMRTKTLSQPVVLLPNGVLEKQDVGITLGDLLRYYPNYYLLESYQSNKPKPHRAASYVLRDDGAYKLVRDDHTIDVQAEFSMLNEKLESLQQDNALLQSRLDEVLSLAIQSRKDQMIVKQNFANSCQNCNESLKFKLNQKCKFCDGDFCSLCVVRVSFPVGFRKNKEVFLRPKKCCLLCIASVFYLRNNPPLEQISTVNKVIMEKIMHNTPNNNLPANEKRIMNSRISDMIPLWPRTKKSEKECEFENFTGSYFHDGTFYSSGDSKISLPLKFLDPLCRLTFWFSGVGEDLKFDRKTIDRATGTKYSITNKANKVILIDVPEFWPDLLSNEESVSGKTAPILCTTVHQMEVLVFFPSKMVGPWPVILFYHGGGFCVGRPTDQIYENACSKIANETGCVVVSVDYRLAPESKFPTQIEDSYAALLWVYENPERLNIDREKIIVCGDSAGGTIAAVMALIARDRNGPKITHQILVYPCVTYPLDESLESHRRYKDGPILSQKILRWFLTQLSPAGTENLHSFLDHIYASPLNADLSNLPPATIINAFHDPLRDHGELYAEKLRRAGIRVYRTVYRKSTHGFFGAPTKESDECLMEICTSIRIAFGIETLDTEALDRLYIKHLNE